MEDSEQQRLDETPPTSCEPSSCALHSQARPLIAGSRVARGAIETRGFPPMHHNRGPEADCVTVDLFSSAYACMHAYVWAYVRAYVYWWVGGAS